MATKAFEVNFDGLVGPTHNYAGLSYGNVASVSHKSMDSNPREAALQGLRKMKNLHDLGFKQALLPPQERPDVSVLRALGFTGTDQIVIESAAKTAPMTLSAVSSASSMWTANAGTISPSADSEDRKVHFTPANLMSKFHRSIEFEQTGRIFRAVFKNPKYFVHHAALPSGYGFGDEGAANHTRLCTEYGKSGVQLFVYSKYGFEKMGISEPKKFPARQTREASEAIARLHLIKESSVVFAQQNPVAIDAGAFHNDVVSVGNRNVIFYHEEAFLNSQAVMNELAEKFRATTSQELIRIEVKSAQIPLQAAVQSYLFNSQLISHECGRMTLIAPLECQEVAPVKIYLDSLMAAKNSPIGEVQYYDLRQSMRNGGGPACLRLRVVLNEVELAHAHPGVFMSDELYPKLISWVEKNYRDRISPADLADPKLLIETRKTLDELTQILGMGSLYPFQK